MHLFLNGLAASAGGGLTYLRNVLPELSTRPGIHATVALSEELRGEFEGLANLTLITTPAGDGSLRRFWREQSELPRFIERSEAEILVSAGNFSLRKSPVPQILLSGNSLYTSKDFYADLRSRGDYGLLVDTIAKGVIAKRSVAWADCTVAPTQAFADELRRWTGANVAAVHHGFDHERFFAGKCQLPGEVQQSLDANNDAFRLLFVSHYNYYRNFETLFRAIPIIQKKLGSRPVKLFLTCRLASGKNPGTYDTESASALVRELDIGDSVVQLGAVSYELLHLLYRSCDVYATAAYAETFAHPVVEAMASGLPTVASDLAVHREVCGDAALYFDRFSAELLAKQVLRIAGDKALAKSLGEKGRGRSRTFSWRHHVDQIIGLAAGLSAK